MMAIRNHNNTLIDYNVSKQRLQLLMDRKEALYLSFFSSTQGIQDMPGGSTVKSDKMAEYLIALEKKNKNTGLSLDEEITLQKNETDKLKYYLNAMEHQLKQLKGLEAKLYEEIVFNGLSVTKAVERVAIQEEKDHRTIWRYYKKIEQYTKKL